VLPDLKHEAPLRNQRGFFSETRIPKAKRSGIR